MIRRALAAAVAALTLTGCVPWLHIQGRSHPVQHGGPTLTTRQQCLDNGNVCTLDGAYANSQHVGAHRSTHGAIGRYWPNLRIGDAVYYNGRRYILYSKRIVPYSCGACANAGDFVLQTSATFEGGGAWLLHFGRGS